MINGIDDIGFYIIRIIFISQKTWKKGIAEIS